MSKIVQSNRITKTLNLKPANQVRFGHGLSFYKFIYDWEANIIFDHRKNNRNKTKPECLPFNFSQGLYTRHVEQNNETLFAAIYYEIYFFVVSIRFSSSSKGKEN